MIGDNVVIDKIHHTKKDKILPLVLKSYFCEKLVITIGGESGTGKTEIASLIQDDLWNEHRIRCKVIHIDDYYKTSWQDRNIVRKKNGIKSVGTCEIDWDILNDVVSDFKSKKKILKVQRIHKYTNSIEYCMALNKNIDILVLEGLYANHLPTKNIGIYLDGTITDTKKFRESRGKEAQTPFRMKVLKKERQDVIKTKRLANVVIPFKVK